MFKGSGELLELRAHAASLSHSFSDLSNVVPLAVKGLYSMYICIYVCKYIHMYIDIYEHICVYICRNIYIYTYIHKAQIKQAEHRVIPNHH